MAQPYRGGRTPVDTLSGSVTPAGGSWSVSVEVGARYPRAVPEFLEVEIYRQLAEEALDRTIASVISPDAWFLKGATTGPALRRALVGQEFVAARRIGKLLLLDVDSGPTVGIRFGMTGTLLVDDRAGVEDMYYAPKRRLTKWDRWKVRFEDGGSLVVQDPRRLGGVQLEPDVSQLGPDAAAITAGELASALGESRTALKARLLDQSKVAGIGNLFADELLWRAGLSPLRPSDSLTPNEVRRLHRQLRRTVDLLGRRGGSHTGDLMEERHPGGRCPRDGTELIRSTVGGRTSWWCPTHQG
jgi:formamidopyrimidine-DNA glycosylase